VLGNSSGLNAATELSSREIRGGDAVAELDGKTAQGVTAPDEFGFQLRVFLVFDFACFHHGLMYNVATSLCSILQESTEKMQKSVIFSERLVLRRNRLNLTQPALAEKADVSARSISDYEQGKADPTLGQIEKLAHALEVSAAWLVGAENMHGELAEAARPMAGDLKLRQLSMNVLEGLFTSLGNEIKQASGHDRTRAMDLLNAVHSEMSRREAEATPKIEGEGISAETKERALAGRDVAGQMFRSDDPKYRQSDKAASPSDSKGAPTGGAPTKKGGGSGGQSQARNG